MIEADRLRADQEKQKQQTEAQRRQSMLDMAAAFEKAVGGIVETVSSSSTELEAAATTLTKTAETTQQLATTVASASEEASTNVQSVATRARRWPRRSSRSAGRFGVEPDLERGGRPGAKNRRAHHQACRRRRAASAT